MPKLKLNHTRTLEDSVNFLREIKDLQCSEGNWNYNEYMHGMANGLIFALSLFDGKEPDFLEIPEKWMKDNPVKDMVAKWNYRPKIKESKFNVLQQTKG